MVATGSIKLANGTSPRFEINRGIRQGCPISAFLFLVVAQVLSNMIINIPSRVLQFMKDKLKYRNLLNDTTFFLGDSSEIPLALNIINDFSKFSGLKLNLSKCEILQLKNNNLSTVC